MRFLFIHQNFPAQFRHIAPALVAEGHNVTALTLGDTPTGNWRGVNILKYRILRGNTNGVHPWVTDFETKIIRGEACLEAALTLKRQGYNPSVIIAHPGWGESLFLKQVWPSATLKLYCEWYYHSRGHDVGFDPEFKIEGPKNAAKVEIKNANFLLHTSQMDYGICPTHFQESTFPRQTRGLISVIHDGIDTSKLKPKSGAKLTLRNNITLTRKHEIVTYVSRALEPYRGFHIFMRAIPKILRTKPNAIILIVGKEGVSYGATSVTGRSWKEVYSTEVLTQLSKSEAERIHFVGFLPRLDFTSLLQITSVHVYLTYPFVLSWSLLEAMSIGCSIVASNTKPVQEFITHNETGVLTDFFDVEGLADRILDLLGDKTYRKKLGENARRFIQSNYDLNSVCLPKQLKWAQYQNELS